MRNGEGALSESECVCVCICVSLGTQICVFLCLHVMVLWK